MVSRAAGLTAALSIASCRLNQDSSQPLPGYTQIVAALADGALSVKRAAVRTSKRRAMPPNRPVRKT
jgi:hypothetical protein